MEKEIEQVREFYREGKTRDASWRKQQLKGLHKFMTEREDDIFRALKLDLGKHPVESYRDEVGTLIKDINAALDNLADWMSGKKIKLPLAAYRTSAKLIAEPLGVVLIFSSWNFPVGLTLEPLIGALAAGCTAVVKPSELAPASSKLLSEAIPAYVDSSAVKFIQGGIDVCTQLLQYKWDKIFFTGGSRVGRIVMSAAAQHLTPVVLELGGKSPCIVDSFSKSWLTQVIVKRLLGGKFGICGGQVCIGVDYILIERKQSSELVELLKEGVKNTFGEKNPETCMTRIINKAHFNRLKGLIEEPQIQNSIVFGGSFDEERLYIEPTILVDPPLDSEIMTEEIFGPLLPIITYAAEAVPFGGVGESGFGRYHGKYSFDTFSHEKPVLKRSLFPDFWFRYPPWTSKKLQLLREAFSFNYFSIILVTLGLKKPTTFLKDI